jgi:hypothetical protein
VSNAYYAQCVTITDDITMDDDDDDEEVHSPTPAPFKRKTLSPTAHKSPYQCGNTVKKNTNKSIKQF